MKNIVITFQGGQTVKATILVDQEPELAANFLDKLKEPVELICNHAVSAGKIFDAYARPSREPIAVLKGNHLVDYANLVAGDILWDGEKLSVVYGDVMQPGTAGCVIGKAAVDLLFEKACMSVWNDIYREHRVSVITISEE